jgi:hypothetical protein
VQTRLPTDILTVKTTGARASSVSPSGARVKSEMPFVTAEGLGVTPTGHPDGPFGEAKVLEQITAGPKTTLSAAYIGQVSARVAKIATRAQRISAEPGHAPHPSRPQTTRERPSGTRALGVVQGGMEGHAGRHRR